MATYSIVGVGGVGGFYGIHLARVGLDVHFLIRGPQQSPGDRRAAPTLTLTSHDQEWTLDPQADSWQLHTSWATMTPRDIVIVATKTTANREVLGYLPALVKPGGTVVVIQNGMDVEPDFAAALPGVEVVGGLAFLAAERVARHHIVHHDYGALTLARFAASDCAGPAHVQGYRTATPTPAMSALAEDLQRAGVPVVLSEDLLHARWQKLLWNIPFNGLSVLLGATTEEMMADPVVERMARGLMAEVLAGAAADGRHLPDGVVDGLIDYTRAMRPYASSMKVDFDHRRPLEIERMYLAPLARARAGGAEMPRVGMLADLLAYHDRRNRGVEAGE